MQAVAFRKRLMDYYNKERYQWELAKLSPDEFYEFYTTGEYPLKVENPPVVPVSEKPASELGRKTSGRDTSQSAEGTKTVDSTG